MQDLVAAEGMRRDLRSARASGGARARAAAGRPGRGRSSLSDSQAPRNTPAMRGEAEPGARARRSIDVVRARLVERAGRARAASRPARACVGDHAERDRQRGPAADDLAARASAIAEQRRRAPSSRSTTLNAAQARRAPSSRPRRRRTSRRNSRRRAAATPGARRATISPGAGRASCRLRLRRQQRVAQQHRDRHRADAAGHRRDQRGALGGRREGRRRRPGRRRCG